MTNDILRKQLEKQGLTPEAIDEVIKNVVTEVMEAEKEQEKLLTVKEVAAIMQKEVPGEKWNEAKVRRYISTNELKTVNEVDRKPEDGKAVATKTGYRVHEDVLKEFIKEVKMTKKDWKDAYNALKKEYDELKARLEKYESKNEENESSENPQEAEFEEKEPEGVLVLPSEEKSKIDGNMELENEEKEEKTLDLTKIKITYAKLPKNANPLVEDWEVTFKLNDKKFIGNIKQVGGNLQHLISIKPYPLTSGIEYNRYNSNEEEEQIKLIERELFDSLIKSKKK